MKMRPGEVTSDQQAFQQVLGRLESEVGTIHRLIASVKQQGVWPDTAPLWGLVRMTFPIAESVGDLIYRSTSTVQNLVSVLENEFDVVKPGQYRGKANILALLFRHSLTHTDELRRLVTGGRDVGWALSWNKHPDHLKILNPGPGVYALSFDTSCFYDDLVMVIRTAMAKNWNGDVMRRYNRWLSYDLDAVTHPGRNVRDGIGEIAAL
jgi:hypothetical protein